MLTVTGRWATRTIAQTEVVRVAKGAQEQVLLDSEDHSLDMGICAQISDSVVYGGLKKTTLGRIHDLSRHTAALHLEFEKPGDKRNMIAIKTHVDEIAESQEKIKKLTSGETLEFGRKNHHPVMGQESYLIHRTPQKIAPTGIALYQPTETCEVIPVFEKADDIRPEHIEQIRSSGKLRCQGQVYTLRFNHRHQPFTLKKMGDEGWMAVSDKLTEIYQQTPHLFAPSRHVEEAGDILISTYPGEDASEASNPDVIPERIPFFETSNEITIKDFEKIQTKGQLRVGEKTFQVKFHVEDEPILLCDSTDIFAKDIQLRLTSVWIAYRASHARNQLLMMSKTDASIPWQSILAELEEVRLKTSFDEPGTARELSWDRMAAKIVKKFTTAVQHIQKDVEADKARLIEVLNNVASNRYPVLEQTTVLFQSLEKIGAIAARQETVNKNINQVKGIYLDLFAFARASTTLAMRDIVKQRIDRFSVAFDTFVRSEMTLESFANFNHILKNQTAFLEKFNATHLSQCLAILYPSNIALQDGTKVTANKEAITTQLIELLTNPAASWQNIVDNIENLHVKQSLLCHALAYQFNTGTVLDKALQSMVRVIFQHGAEPVGGKSVYNSKIYSRIVSIKKISDTLFNRNQVLSKQEVDQKGVEINKHLAHILRETGKIDENAKKLFFIRHVTYKPYRNPDGSLMDYTDWCKSHNETEQELTE